MLNVMRKLRWGRAWVAAGLVCAVVGLPVVCLAQSESTGVPGQTSGATAQSGTSPSGVPASATSSAESQDAAQNQDEAANPDSSAGSTDNSTVPVAKNLETGAPLRTVLTPLHWGHLSLLSFQGFEVYDSNYQPQQAIVSRQMTALQGLVVYSIQKASSSLDLQYEPYVWFSPNQTYKNFTANSVDLATSHTFSRRWRLTGDETFQYSPNLANTLQSAFTTDFLSNTSNQVAFLSAGRESLINNVGVTLTSQISKSSQLSFNLLDDYIRLGSYQGSLNTTLPNVALTMNQYGGGVTWTRQWSTKTSLNLAYNFRRQSASLFAANSTFNTVDVGFNRVLKPNLSFSLQVGPGWSDAGGVVKGTPTQRRTTVQGSAQLLKSFRTGGIAFSFYRNSEYSGVISNSFNNRYDVSVNRRFFTRWNFLVSGSYIQQEYVGKPMSTGELGWAQLGYMLTRNWSVFSGYRYLNLGGNEAWSGPQQLVTAGIRWAWQPSSR